MKIEVDDMEKRIEDLKEIVNYLKEIDKESVNLCFVGIEEMMKRTGWSKKTVQELFNRPDFPSTDFGKEKKAEIHAVIKYFSVPRRK